MKPLLQRLTALTKIRILLDHLGDRQTFGPPDSQTGQYIGRVIDLLEETDYTASIPEYIDQLRDIIRSGFTEASGDIVDTLRRTVITPEIITIQTDVARELRRTARSKSVDEFEEIGDMIAVLLRLSLISGALEHMALWEWIEMVDTLSGVFSPIIRELRKWSEEEDIDSMITAALNLWNIYFPGTNGTSTDCDCLLGAIRLNGVDMYGGGAQRMERTGVVYLLLQYGDMTGARIDIIGYIRTLGLILNGDGLIDIDAMVTNLLIDIDRECTYYTRKLTSGAPAQLALEIGGIIGTLKVLVTLQTNREWMSVRAFLAELGKLDWHYISRPTHYHTLYQSRRRAEELQDGVITELVGHIPELIAQLNTHCRTPPPRQRGTAPTELDIMRDRMNVMLPVELRQMIQNRWEIALSPVFQSFKRGGSARARSTFMALGRPPTQKEIMFAITNFAARDLGAVLTRDMLVDNWKYIARQYPDHHDIIAMARAFAFPIDESLTVDTDIWYGLMLDAPPEYTADYYRLIRGEIRPRYTEIVVARLAPETVGADEVIQRFMDNIEVNQIFLSRFIRGLSSHPRLASAILRPQVRPYLTDIDIETVLRDMPVDTDEVDTALRVYNLLAIRTEYHKQLLLRFLLRDNYEEILLALEPLSITTIRIILDTFLSRVVMDSAPLYGLLRGLATDVDVGRKIISMWNSGASRNATNYQTLLAIPGINIPVNPLYGLFERMSADSEGKLRLYRRFPRDEQIRLLPVLIRAYATQIGRIVIILEELADSLTETHIIIMLPFLNYRFLSIYWSSLNLGRFPVARRALISTSTARNYDAIYQTLRPLDREETIQFISHSPQLSWEVVGSLEIPSGYRRDIILKLPKSQLHHVLPQNEQEDDLLAQLLRGKG